LRAKDFGWKELRARKLGEIRRADEKIKTGKKASLSVWWNRIKTGVKRRFRISERPTSRQKPRSRLNCSKKPSKTQVFLSIFSPQARTTLRAIAPSASFRTVFLHLHPAKINRDSVRYSYTWGMGGSLLFVICSR